MVGLTTHEQVLVKVNAECDRAIAPLVTALNELAGVFTLESCQEWQPGEAIVWFTYGTHGTRSSADAATFIERLSCALAEAGIACERRISMEWLGSNDQPRIILTVPTDQIQVLAEGVGLAANRINGHTSA